MSLAPTLFYDADCAVCTRLARWGKSRTGDRVEFRPMQHALPGSYGIEAEEWPKAAWWIQQGLPPERGARAVGHVLVRCGRGWRILGVLCLVQPTALLARGIYACVARYRRLIPGGSTSCGLPGSKS